MFIGVMSLIALNDMKKICLKNIKERCGLISYFFIHSLCLVHINTKLTNFSPINTAAAGRIPV